VPSTPAGRLETGPPEHVDTDDDTSSRTSDSYRNVDCKSCIHKSRPTNYKLAIITMFKLRPRQSDIRFFSIPAMRTASTANMAEEVFNVVIVTRRFVLLFSKYRFRHRYRFKSTGSAPVSVKKQTIPIPTHPDLLDAVLSFKSHFFGVNHRASPRKAFPLVLQLKRTRCARVSSFTTPTTAHLYLHLPNEGAVCTVPWWCL